MAVATSGTALLRFGEGPRPVDTATAAGGGVLGGTVVWLRASCGVSPPSIAPEPAPVAEEVLPDWLHSGVGTRRERADRKPPDGSSRERILPVMCGCLSQHWGGVGVAMCSLVAVNGMWRVLGDDVSSLKA